MNERLAFRQAIVHKQGQLGHGNLNMWDDTYSMYSYCINLILKKSSVVLTLDQCKWVCDGKNIDIELCAELESEF